MNIAWAQKSTGIVVDLDQIENDNKRDEIQRYIGYEDLIFRYLTLPYDLSTNTNEQGRFVDFGFALFALLPLVLLGAVYKNKRLFYALIVILCIYLCLCLSYSFFQVPGLGVVRNHAEFYGEYLKKGDGVYGHEFMKVVFELTYPIAKPFRNLGQSISGNADHITYPFIIGVFTLFMGIVLRFNRFTETGKFIFILFGAFSFIWLMLSGGIIWYGFLIIPFGYLLVTYFLSKKNLFASGSFSVLKKISILTLTLATLIAYVGRISNITAPNMGTKEDVGKKLLESNIYQYSAGLIGTQQALNNSYSNIGNVLDQINSNEALVYQIGTFLAFDIEQNQTRIFSDQTLEGFYWLIRQIREKEEIISALKISGFKYIIVDLYTHTLDNTPEKSLTKKYQLLLNSLYQNPSVQLLATDRIVEIQQADGSKVRQSEVFGKQITNYGSYAIYEIL